MGKLKALEGFKGGTAVALDKHRRIIREATGGDRSEKRMQNIQARHEILRAAEAYSARVGRDRVTAHLHSRAPALQSAAALHHIGELNNRIHRLAGKGLHK